MPIVRHIAAVHKRGTPSAFRSSSSALPKPTARRSPGAALRHKSTRAEPESFSVLHSASDFITALRWKAARTLAASLSSEERDQLLGQLQPKTKKTDTADGTPTNGSKPSNDGESGTPEEASMMMHKSVAEAVAEARLQESKRHESKWRLEKDRIIQEAEKAAQARVESALATQQRNAAFEKWEQQVREARGEHETENSAQASSDATDQNRSQKETEESKNESVHPILGRVIEDFGYKRVHVTSAKALSSIPVWKKQRIYRHNRAKSMVNDKMKTLHLGLHGVIGLHEDPDGSLSILDGQHRVGMMTMLQEKGDLNGLDLDRILVEVYPQNYVRDCGKEIQNDESHAQDIFLEVNKAEPVKLVDMPGVAKSTDRKIITDGAAKLHDRYPDMFSASQKCRAPHVNVDNLRDALFASDVIKRNKLRSAKALEKWLLRQNDSLRTKFQSEDSQQNIAKSALKKALKFDFYLGLESSWLYN